MAQISELTPLQRLRRTFARKLIGNLYKACNTEFIILESKGDRGRGARYDYLADLKEKLQRGLELDNPYMKLSTQMQEIINTKIRMDQDSTTSSSYNPDNYPYSGLVYQYFGTMCPCNDIPDCDCLPADYISSLVPEDNYKYIRNLCNNSSCPCYDSRCVNGLATATQNLSNVPQSLMIDNDYIPPEPPESPPPEPPIETPTESLKESLKEKDMMHDNINKISKNDKYIENNEKINNIMSYVASALDIIDATTHAPTHATLNSTPSDPIKRVNPDDEYHDEYHRDRFLRMTRMIGNPYFDYMSPDDIEKYISGETYGYNSGIVVGGVPIYFR